MSDKTKSATEARYQEHVARRSYGRLAAYPDHQAETIARHYLNHATLSRDLLKLVRIRQTHPVSDATNSLIDSMVRKIKDGHKSSFGIELEWPTG